MRTVLAIAVSFTIFACGETEKNAPLPEPNLEARNAAINEAREKIEILQQATAMQAVALMNHSDHRVRRAAIKRLGTLKEAPKPAVEALLTAINDKNDTVRIEAAMALETVQSEEAVDALIHALVDPSIRVRQWAYKALRKLGSTAVPQMIAQLSNPAPKKDENRPQGSNDVRNLEKVLLESLSEMGKAAVPHLISTIENKKGKAARDAVVLLGKIGKDAQEGIHILLDLLNTSTDNGLKKDAITAIGEIGDVDPEVIPTLMTLAENAGGPVAKEAAKTLKKLQKSS